MAADSLVTEKAVVDLANAINANKAGKSELEAIANAVDALPSGGGTLTPSTTDVLI